MTDRDKAQIIGGIVLDLNEVNQELTCTKAKAAKMAEKLEGIVNRLKPLSENTVYPAGLPDGDFSLEGVEDPRQLMERILSLYKKRDSLNGRLRELGVWGC